MVLFCFPVGFFLCQNSSRALYLDKCIDINMNFDIYVKRSSAKQLKNIVHNILFILIDRF